MSFFLNQTNATFYLDTKIQLDTASEVSIDFKRPDNTTGNWVGTADGTKVVYTVQAGDLNQVGAWKLQAKVVIDGKTAKGEIVDFPILKPII